MDPEAAAPDFPDVSPLPETPIVPHVLTGPGSVTYDLSRLSVQPTRDLRIFQTVVFLAFVVGIAAVGVFVYIIYSGRAPNGGDEVSAWLQINVYAYLSAATGLFLFRMNRNPPISLEVSRLGLMFGFPSGRRVTVTWDKLPGQTQLFENPRFEKLPLPKDMQLQLYTIPRYTLLWALAFLPPRVPRTYLTRHAFNGILDAGSRAGLTVTRYGDRYVFDRLNPMQFPSRF